MLSFGVVGVVVFKSYQFAEEQRQKIYVLDNGKSLMVALSQDMSINRPVEAREHVRRFHELFFTIAPDKDAIESNVKGPSIWLTNPHLTTTKTSRRKDTITGLFPVISSRGLKWTVLLPTSTVIPTP